MELTFSATLHHYHSVIYKALTGQIQQRKLAGQELSVKEVGVNQELETGPEIKCGIKSKTR